MRKTQNLVVTVVIEFEGLDGNKNQNQGMDFVLEKEEHFVDWKLVLEQFMMQFLYDDLR